MANRRPYSHSTQEDISRNVHVRTHETIIASGGVEAAYYAGGAVLSAAWIATRQNDLYWAAGASLISFFAAGGAREDSAIRDISLGILGGSAATLAIRLMGKLARTNGQQ